MIYTLHCLQGFLTFTIIDCDSRSITSYLFIIIIIFQLDTALYVKHLIKRGTEKIPVMCI